MRLATLSVFRRLRAGALLAGGTAALSDIAQGQSPAVVTPLTCQAAPPPVIEIRRGIPAHPDTVSLTVLVESEQAPRAPVADAVVELAAEKTRVARRTSRVGVSRFPHLRPGRQILRVRAMGYEARSSAVTVRAGGADTLVVTLRGVTSDPCQWQ